MISGEDGEQVLLHVYDLSQGWAAKLSQSVVGRKIDGIWHTGVVVSGREWFWGGELQCLPAGRTPFGSPTKRLPLGTTHIPLELIGQFVDELRPQFNQQTYSLLGKNCNTFSNELALFLTGKGIPQEIVGLPDEFLATPLGAALRPIIQSWEQQSRAALGITTPSPAAAAAAAAPPPAPPPPVVAAAAAKMVTKGAAPLLSCQGSAKPFITKLRSMRARAVPEEVLAALDAANVSAPMTVLPQSLFALTEDALVTWGPEECAPLLFTLRSVAMRNDFVAHYVGDKAAATKLAVGLQRCVVSDIRNCSLLSMAVAANTFATQTGAKMMLEEPLVSVVVAALDKLRAEDAATRLMAAALVHNAATIGPLPTELLITRIADGIAAALLSLYPQESGSEDAELRTLVALGLLLLNNSTQPRQVAARVRDNADLMAFLVARAEETAMPRSAQVTAEIIALLAESPC